MRKKKWTKEAKCREEKTDGGKYTQKLQTPLWHNFKISSWQSLTGWPSLHAHKNAMPHCWKGVVCATNGGEQRKLAHHLKSRLQQSLKEWTPLHLSTLNISSWLCTFAYIFYVHATSQMWSSEKLLYGAWRAMRPMSSSLALGNWLCSHS